MTQWKNFIERRSRSHILVSSAISLALLTASIGFAESLSPVGQWQTVSDVTGKATSIVRISLENGELVGMIEKLIREPGQDPNPLCTECPDEKKDQPVQGMTILWGLEQDDEEWNGGFILGANFASRTAAKNWKCAAISDSPSSAGRRSGFERGSERDGMVGCR